MNDPVRFPGCDAMPNIIKIFGKDNMISIEGAEHTVARNLLAPAFSGTLLEDYFQLVRNRVDSTLESVLARANDSSLREPIKLGPVFRELTLGIIIEMTTGARWDSDYYMKTFRENCNIILAALSMVPFDPGWNRALRARDEVRAIMTDIVKDRLSQDGAVIDEIRSQLDDFTANSRIAPINSIDFLHVMIAKSHLSTAPGAQLDDDSIGKLVRLIVSIWFAGFATTASTMACAAFELGWNAELFDRLTEEQDALVSMGGKVEIPMKELKKMPLLDVS